MKVRIVSCFLALLLLMTMGLCPVSVLGLTPEEAWVAAIDPVKSGMYELEFGKITSGETAAVRQNYSGTGYVLLEGGAAVTVTVTVQETADYGVRLRYFHGGAANVPLQISVNGTVVRTSQLAPVLEDTTWAEQLESLPLEAGDNTVTYALQAGASSSLAVDQIRLSRIYEAEDAVHLNNMSNNKDHPGYTGTGFAAGFQGAGQGLIFSINALEAGAYTLVIRYANGAGDGYPRAVTMAINGTEQTVAMPDLKTWDVWGEMEFTVLLNAGANTITLYKGEGNYGNVNVDCLTLAKCYWTYLGADGELVHAALTAIDAIGVASYRSGPQIAAAQAAYDAVPAQYQCLVTNRDVLPAAAVAYENYLANGWVNAAGWFDNADEHGWSGQPWLCLASGLERQATWNAIEDEVYYQYLELGYDYGVTGNLPIGNYMQLASVGNEGVTTSNVGNPWGQAGRYVAWIQVPFTGMAFSDNGYFSAHYNYMTCLGNSFVYNGVCYLQTWGQIQNYDASIPLERDSSMKMNTPLPYFPGGLSNGSDAANLTFRYAYANYNQMHKWEGLAAGLATDYAQWMAGNTILYQSFVSEDGTVILVNTADRIQGVSTTDESTIRENAAFVVSGPVLDSISETLGTAAPAEIFTALGAAVSEAYVDDSGATRQSFQKGEWVVEADGSAAWLEATTTVSSVTGPDVLCSQVDGTHITLLLAAGADPSQVTLQLDLPAGSTLSPGDTALDLSGETTLTVTGSSGNSAVYTLHPYVMSDVTAADEAAAAQMQTLLSQIPQQLYRNTMDTAEQAMVAYAALTDLQKLLVGDASVLQTAVAQMDEIRNSPIRITCVGDSITEGVGSTNKALYSYPAQLQALLGEDYLVNNVGVSGTCVVRDQALSSYPYVTTNQYWNGLASAPDLVFIMLGTNDATGSNWSNRVAVGQDIPTIFRQDYETLIQEYQALESHPEIILCLPMTTSDATRHNNNMTGTIPIIQELAAKYGLEILDTNTLTNFTDDADYFRWFFPDGLHPCDNSYPIVAGWFADAVADYTASISDTSLASLSLAEGFTLDVPFDPTVTQYTVSGGSLTEDSIMALAADPDAAVQIQVQGDTATVTVASALGSFGTIYTLTAAPVLTVLLGDLNEDGNLSVTDVVLLRKAILQGEPQADVLQRGDLNEDGVLSVTDVVLLRKAILARS